MSGDEKAQQIGQVVTEYQSAKVDLAHVEQKLKRIGNTYTEVGSALSGTSSMSDFKIENGHFQFVYPRHLTEPVGVNLLNEQELITVISERNRLSKQVAELRSQLQNLGITSVE
ncbi:MAG: hypothetical protein WAN97_05435 [Candidatus Acidiferrales bacterium]